MLYKTESGRTIELEKELTASDMEALGLSLPSQYERVPRGEKYMFADSKGRVDTAKDLRNGVSGPRHATANYFTDPDLAQIVVNMEVAIRAMVKFSVENGGAELIKNPADKTPKYFIKYRANKDNFFADDNRLYSQIAVPFVSKEVADKFIAENEDILRKALGLK